jgi:hypothetical protein
MGMWDEARVLEVERYRKYKELAHISCSTNPVWTFILSGSPLSAMRLPTQDLYDVTDSECVSIRI